jgi:hypothetical protein
MERWVDITWVGVNIPCEGGQYTMGRGLIYHGKRVNIPWVWDRYTMERGVDIPWVGGLIYHG